MKRIVLSTVLGFLTGCSVTAWKDTGQPGPWCAQGAQAHMFYRTVDSFGAPNAQGQMALAGKSGGKNSQVSFYHELDKYFAKCTFINQWPTHGFVNSIPSHQSPFDLCMVSMNPTVIMGVERKNPEVSSLGPVSTWGCAFIGSTFLRDPIAIRTSLPYHVGAKVIWFSPALDYDLHQLDLTSGVASFPISRSEQIAVTVDGAELKTSRR
jgi:hypothetical protein